MQNRGNGNRGQAAERRRRPEPKTGQGPVSAGGPPEPKTGQGPVRRVLRWDLQPSPENDELYRPVDKRDPEIRALAQSIREHGLREPIVVSQDGFIISGHRRHAACELAGLDLVPVRVEDVSRFDDEDAFVVLLREYNRQRDKSLEEKLREELVTASPEVAYEALVEHRMRREDVELDAIELRKRKPRARITKAKAPFLDAVKRVIEDQRDFLPLSDRRIHYALLNDPPLKHASKPDSVYRNDQKSYKSLVDLLTRARIAGEISMRAIADDTRPQWTWRVHEDPRPFIRDEVESMFAGYYRDLQATQPHHLEIVVEKNTVEPIIRPIAEQYCIPLTSGRGYCSLPPRAAMARRFERASDRHDKDRMIVLFVSDFDPDGEEIAHSFAASMRDDFAVPVQAVKVALTHDQVQERNLAPNMQAKESSSRYDAFVEKYGLDVYELEAIPPADLQQVVRDAIDSVLDTDAFNAELEQEKQDAAWLDEMRQRVHAALKGVA